MDRQAANHHILKAIPRDVGPRVHTRGGGAVHSVRPPGSQTFTSSAHCVAVMLAASPRIQGGFASDKFESFDATAGMIAISPANMESKLIWPYRRENVVVAIESERLADLSASELDVGNVELRATHAVVDPQALQLAQLLKAELARNEPPNELYIDSLITLFGVHVLRHYSSAGKAPARAAEGLSAVVARKVREYLEERFRHKVTVAELAAVCGLSPGYFIQSFTKTFKMPPHRYLIDRRLALAEKLLVESDLKIAEVALLSGFSSQSHLTTSMRKYRQFTPAQIRSQGSKPPAALT